MSEALGSSRLEIIRAATGEGEVSPRPESPVFPSSVFGGGDTDRMALYALFVGIDEYSGPVSPLQGCVADVRAFAEYFGALAGPQGLRAHVLLDADATRENVMDGFTRHLTQAGPGDTALFCFAGHGSQEPVEERFWHLEPSGFQQTLVCADSRTGGLPDLADKELNELLGGVAAGGAHVLAVLDSCHSGGATREAHGQRRIRAASPVTRPRPLSSYTPGVRAALAAGALPQTARHVSLAACESGQTAAEMWIGGSVRGVFSVVLQRALSRLSRSVTYRDLIGAAAVGVRDRVHGQDPVAFAAEPDDLDQPVLGGIATPRVFDLLVERYRGSWWLNAGSIHGIVPPIGELTTTLAVDTAPLSRVTVTEVEPVRCRVAGADGLDPADRHPVRIVGVPLPPALVDLQGDLTAIALVREALDGSAHTAEGADPGPEGDRFLVLATSDTLTVTRADGTPLADPCPATAAGARRTVSRLDHLARWHTLRRLDNPLTRLPGSVSVELLTALPGESPPRPGTRAPLTPAVDGAVHLPYPSAHQTPQVYVYLHNLSDRPLFVALLNLTDRYRCHAGLFSGDHIPAGGTAVAHGGRPVSVSIPRERLSRAEPEVRDWLKVVAAERRFSSDAFELPVLDGAHPSVRAVGGGILETLALRRDFGDAPQEVYEWTTSILEVRTHLPKNSPHA
ncbi:caspase family protein [Streptomyces stelliscabiei]|uniref:caspase family protein n=1 Tax=Streptomyces stelliscabiei TaxID=146820 RepID=UPI002FF3104F